MAWLHFSLGVGADRLAGEWRTRVEVGELRAQAVQAQLQEAQETLARLQRVEQRLQHEINELQELRPRFPERRRGDPAREAPVPALLALTDFVEAELAKRLELRRRLSDEIAEAARELDLRTHRLAETSTA